MLSKFLQKPELSTYGEGHEASSTLGYNTDDPVMLMEEHADLEDIIEHPHNLPLRITVRAQIEGVPLTEKRTQIQSVINETVFPAGPLYDASFEDEVQHDLARYGQKKSVRLLYAGLMLVSDRGRISGSVPETYWPVVRDDDLLFEKQFYVQTEAQLTQRKRFVDPNWVTIPAGHHVGQSNITPLHGFAGYYKPGATPLEQIAQVYFTINQDDHRALPQLQTTGYWRAKKCVPPHGGLIGSKEQGVFIDPLSPSQCRSLAGDIQDGSVTLTLTNEHGETFAYASYGHTQKEITSPLVDIHLTLKSGDSL